MRDSFEGTGLLIDTFQFCTDMENIYKGMVYTSVKYRVKGWFLDYKTEIKNLHVNRLEDKIRDKIAERLDEFDPNLTLIRKEYPLKAKIGSKGFIDILAKDNRNRYVIIELKRSKSASRQTLNEILKYRGLLKADKGVKNHEIRIVVISTEWDELIVPYSEVNTKIRIEGYKLEIDDDAKPINYEYVEPLDTSSQSRNISPTHLCDLFRTLEKRTEFLKILPRLFSKVDIEDFVSVVLSYTKSPINYNFATYIAWQRKPIDEYREIIKRHEHNTELFLDYYQPDKISEYTEEEILQNLENNILSILETHKFSDSIEVGYPEKFQSIVGVQDWKIESVNRHGKFEDDERLTDEQIINEIKGLSDYNSNSLFVIFDNFDADRIKEIINLIKNKTNWDKDFKYQICTLIQEVFDRNCSVQCLLQCYYPDSLMGSIFLSKKFLDNNYLSSAELLVFDFDDNSESLYEHYQINSYVEDDETVLEKMRKKIEQGKMLTMPEFAVINSMDDQQLMEIWNHRFTIDSTIYTRNNGIIEYGFIYNNGERINVLNAGRYQLKLLVYSFDYSTLLKLEVV